MKALDDALDALLAEASKRPGRWSVRLTRMETSGGRETIATVQRNTTTGSGAEQVMVTTAPSTDAALEGLREKLRGVK